MVGENLHQSWESWFFNSRRGLVGLSSFEDWHFKHICPTQKLDENLSKTTQKSKLHNSTVVFFLPIHFSDNCAQCSYGFYQEGDFCHHSELVAHNPWKDAGMLKFNPPFCAYVQGNCIPFRSENTSQSGEFLRFYVLIVQYGSFKAYPTEAL